ncbi:MAG: hypothetical protein JSV96_05555 [Candidatus Aminicenantes bacterium]|nr:MAG: hypothetical protein JSV96_05555 [Candidatus Aminicenantes bacterium]
MGLVAKNQEKKARSIFRFESRKEKRRHKSELKLIEEEINRSKRHNLNVSVLVVDLPRSTPQGISKLVPGKVISFHAVESHIRSYDRLIIPYIKGRYYIILPDTDKKEANAVKQRIYELSQRYNWGVTSIRIATYPEDGETSEALLAKAIYE